MKRLVMAIMAGMMMTATCFAQNNDAQQRPQRMDKNEMIKMRTDRMVSEYGLNETQAAQLKDLNTNFADKLPYMGGPRQTLEHLNKFVSARQEKRWRLA